MGCYLLTDLEWKIIYVGAAESEEYDQTLDSVLVGPVPAGKHMFVFQVKYTLKICEYQWWNFSKCWHLKAFKRSGKQNRKNFKISVEKIWWDIIWKLMKCSEVFHSFSVLPFHNMVHSNNVTCVESWNKF